MWGSWPPTQTYRQSGELRGVEDGCGSRHVGPLGDVDEDDEGEEVGSAGEQCRSRQSGLKASPALPEPAQQ